MNMYLLMKPASLLWLLFPFLSLSQYSLFSAKNTSVVLMEICDNNIDDDGDGLIDVFDPNCPCIMTNPTPTVGDITFGGIPCESSFNISVQNITGSTYQWYFNETPIIGAVGSALFANIIDQNDEGSYHVQASHANGSCELVGPFDYEEPIIFSAPLETICQGGFYVFQGDTLTMEGTYPFPAINDIGCDTSYLIILRIDTTCSVIEICDNNIDDDGDGLIDVFDPDCACDIAIDSLELVPNGGFEEKVDCCYEIEGPAYNCLEDWVLVFPSPDYYHEDCIGPLQIDFIESLYGVPIIGGFMGAIMDPSNSAEAVGVCLSEPMLAGETYTLSFDLNSAQGFISADGLFTFMGIPDCNNLNDYLNNPAVNICNAGLPYEEFGTVNAFTVGPGWNSFEFQITPTMDIEAIIPYRSCNQPSFTTLVMGIIYDNISIIKAAPVSIPEEIIVSGNPCDGTLEYTVEHNATSTYQWYFNQQSIIGATNSTLAANEMLLDSTGNYHLYVIHDDGNCQLIGPEMYEPAFIGFEVSETICEGEVYHFNNENLTTGGIYRDTLQNAVGCDSILILDLVVNETSQFSFSESICEGEAYSFNNENLSSAGIYLDTLQNAAGCDSILILNLTINTPIENTVIDTACEGETYMFGGLNITTSGEYQQAFIANSTACDSIVNLSISFIAPVFGDTLDVEQEINTTYSFHGTTINQPGVYEVILTASTGCDSTAYLNFSFTDPCLTPFDVVVEWGEPSCLVAQNGWIAFLVDAGAAPYSYSIDGGENFTTNDLFENLPAGQYDLVIIDAYACQEEIPFVLESVPSNLFIELPADTSLFLGQSLTLNIADINFDPVSYSWMSDQTLSCVNCLFTQTTPSLSSFYTLTATDENGCEASDGIFITINQPPNIYIPNAFSPNDDGRNDLFGPFGESENLDRIVDMKIFSRWGELVFDSKNQAPEWDGTYNSKKAVAGVYVYKIEWVNVFGEIEIFSGDVMLFR